MPVQIDPNVVKVKRVNAEQLKYIHDKLVGKVNAHNTDGLSHADIRQDIGTKIGEHNTNSLAHNDIRELIKGLTARLNGVLDSNDVNLDQLSEIVAYIKSNKTLIEQVTTNKVNVTDVVNNLTTNATDKPLSASMGVELKKLIDAISKQAPDVSGQIDTHDKSATSHADIRQDVTTLKENLKESVGVISKAENLLDSRKVEIGCYNSINGDKVISDPNYKTSDFIPFSISDIVRWTAQVTWLGSTSCSLWDENKQIIKSAKALNNFVKTENGVSTLTIDEASLNFNEVWRNAKYIRCSFYAKDLSNAMIVKNIPYPTSYVPYVHELVASELLKKSIKKEIELGEYQLPASVVPKEISDKLNRHDGAFDELVEYKALDLLGDASGYRDARNVTIKITNQSRVLNTATKFIVKGQTSRCNKPVNFKLLDTDVLGMFLFIGGMSKYKLDHIKMCLGAHDDFTMGRKYEVIIPSTALVEGWNLLKFKKSDFKQYGTYPYGDFKYIEFQTNSLDPNAEIEFIVDGFVLNHKRKSVLMINFDDSIQTMYKNGYPYMKSNGIKGTVFLANKSFRPSMAGNPEGAEGYGYMTKEEHDDIYFNGGWEIGMHSKWHNYTHNGEVVDLKSENDYTKQYEDLKYNYDFIISNGWGERLTTFAAPNGKYNATTLRVIKNLGIDLVRAGSVGYITNMDDDMQSIATYEFNSTTTSNDETYKKWINDCIEKGQSLSIFTHGINVGNTDPYSVDVEFFKRFIDFVKTKIDAGLLECMTFNEFYNTCIKK